MALPVLHHEQLASLDSMLSSRWSSCRLLIERFGYSNTFLITAGLKLIAYLPLVPLLAFVDDGVLRIRHFQGQETADPDLQAPLLS